jgi:hypothetical protein
MYLPDYKSFKYHISVIETNILSKRFNAVINFRVLLISANLVEFLLKNGR